MKFPGSGSCSQFLVLSAVALVLRSGAVPAQPAQVAQAWPCVIYSAEGDASSIPFRAIHDRHDGAREARRGARVFTLRTPGGLVDATRDIVTKMIAAKTPIAVYVAPSGARAASAGFIITIAADIAAMAPGTHIGAAHPVAGGGAVMDETTSKKAAEDMAAYVRTIAGKRGRNAPLAEQAVLQSKVTEEKLEGHAADRDLVGTSSTISEEARRRTVTDRRPPATLPTPRPTIVRRDDAAPSILRAIEHPTSRHLWPRHNRTEERVWRPRRGARVSARLFCCSRSSRGRCCRKFAGCCYARRVVLFALEIKGTSYGLSRSADLSMILGSAHVIDSPAPEIQRASDYPAVS